MGTWGQDVLGLPLEGASPLWISLFHGQIFAWGLWVITSTTLCAPHLFRIDNSPGVSSSWACRNRQGTDQSTCYSMEHIYGHQVASVFQAWATWEEELTVYYKGGNRKRQQLARSWGTSVSRRPENICWWQGTPEQRKFIYVKCLLQGRKTMEVCVLDCDFGKVV